MPQGPYQGKSHLRGRLSSCLSALLMGTLCLVCITGCDDRSDVPPPLDTTPKPLVVVPRPTTQQIMSAPWKPLQLLTFPLTMEVPDLPRPNVKSLVWTINSSGSDGSPSQWVEGPAPAGDVMIQMARLPENHTAASITGIENATRKEAAAKPENSLLLSIRALGPVRIIEQRTLRHVPAQDSDFPKPGSQTGELVRTHLPASEDVDWTVRIFIPVGKQFSSGTLTFVGLSKEQYDKDKMFLERLIGSLHYDGANGLLD